jgi:HJR/Mrr/RecB family endonuclease
MYRRFSSRNPVGRVSNKQFLQLVHAMIDHTNLGIANMGITKESTPKEVEELILFVQSAVQTEGKKELAAVKDKNIRSTQDFLDQQYYPKYLAEYDAKVVEHVNSVISKLDSPDANKNKTLSKWVEELEGKWRPLATKPNPPLITISPREAEAYCSQIMLFYGAEGSQTTQYSQDGGIDVISNHFVAQVKHQEAPVGVKIVRETFGVSAQNGKIGIVFGKTGFTNDAISFATRSGILLISYGRRIESWTVATNTALKSGLMSALPDAKSLEPVTDTKIAISWKTMILGAGRDNID